MNDEKPKKGPPLARVIPFKNTAIERKAPPKPLLFYINEKDQLRPTLTQLHSLQIFSIQSMPDLHMAFSLKVPELILIESELTWCSPLIVLHEARRFFDVPSVLFCPSSHSFDLKQLIREAYRNGLYDVLFSPLNVEELSTSLHLILRLNSESLVL